MDQEHDLLESDRPKSSDNVDNAELQEIEPIKKTIISKCVTQVESFSPVHYSLTSPPFHILKAQSASCEETR